MKSFLVFCFVVSVVSARPTFDKIANALLDLVDEQPYRHGRPTYGQQPYIQEGYDHGYDYYYGGGGGYVHGNVPSQNGYYHPKRPIQQPPVYGVGPRPHPAQYPYPVQSPPYGHPQTHDGSYGGNYPEAYGPGGVSYGGSSDYHVHGYKNQGY